MFNKKTLALAFTTLLCASSACAAIVTKKTPLVVGFMPVFKNTMPKGIISGDLVTYSMLTVNQKDIANALGYFDKDGDPPSESEFKYDWTIDGGSISTSHKVALDSHGYIGKRLVLNIWPVSKSGFPIQGRRLVINNLNAAGASLGSGDGLITVPEPTNVIIEFNSTATFTLNGTTGNHPVAGKDKLTAVYGHSDSRHYGKEYFTFQWKADGANIGDAQVGNNTFTPGPEHQGKRISVDVKPWMPPRP